VTAQPEIANKPKKAFEEKWRLVNGKWEGGWQTEARMDVPENLPPYLDNLRIWASEMSQWAQQVNEQIGELISEVDRLKQKLNQQ
jgi:hypothetical protein